MCVWGGGERKASGVYSCRNRDYFRSNPSFWPHLTKITGPRMASGFWAVASGHGKAGVPCAPGLLPTSAPASPDPLPVPPTGPLPQALASCWPTPDDQWRFKRSAGTSSGTAKMLGMSSSHADLLKRMPLIVRAWQPGPWRGDGKPLQHSCLENPMNSTNRQKDTACKDEPPGQ